MESELIVRKYNLKESEPDSRDFLHTFPITKTLESTTSVDLRNLCPSVYNQGSLGSCTSQAVAGAYEFDTMKLKLQHQFTPARLFIYYNTRKIEGHIETDSGATIRNTMKSVNRDGVCPEPIWPYDISKFAVKPSQEAYDSASYHHSIKYETVIQSLLQLKQCLIEGFPFVFGMRVYESFQSSSVRNTGIVPMPQPDETLLGGHAVLCVGYNDQTNQFIVRNSWGSNWGDHGYFYLPYDFMTSPSLVFDIWTLQQVSDTEPPKPEPPKPEPPKPEPPKPEPDTGLFCCGKKCIIL
jgi:C1A family cysteine protease